MLNLASTVAQDAFCPAELPLIKVKKKKEARLSRLTLQVCAGHKLEDLVNEDDGEGELQHHDPLLCVQVRQLEDHLQAGEREREKKKNANACESKRETRTSVSRLWAFNTLRRHKGDLATSVRFFALQRYQASLRWRLVAFINKHVKNIRVSYLVTAGDECAKASRRPESRF